MPNIRDVSLKKPEENPVLGGGQSGIVSPYAPQSNAKAVGSGQFTNLADYVSANQGATQQLGQGIKTDVQNRANQANENIRSTIQNTVQPNVQNFQNTRKTFEGFFNKPSVSQEDISTARNLRTGQNDFSNQYQTAIQNIGTAQNEYNTTRNQLYNLGTGTTLTDYLRGFGENPSQKTLGETGLTRFLVNQSIPGQEALNFAKQQSSNLNYNPNEEMTGLVNAYQQVTPESLQGYADTQRQGFINSLGEINKERARRTIAGNLGISDIGAEERNFRNYSTGLENVNRNLSNYQNILNNINNLSDEQIQNLLSSEVSKNPVAVRPGYTSAGENQILNPQQSYNIGGKVDTGRNINISNLTNRLNKNISPLQEQQQNYQNLLAGNKFTNYQNQLANANTIQSALTGDELSRLQALGGLSGWDYNDFLTRSI